MPSAPLTSVVGLVLVGATAACGGWAARSPQPREPPVVPEAACPRSVPRFCDGTSPTYARDILPILERRCFACHAGDGPAADDHNFAQFATFHAQRRAVADEIAACAMPPAPRATVPREEADAILRWVACGGVER